MAAVQEALSAATNSADTTVSSMPIVKAYQRFERNYVLQREEHVSVSDARKARWLLIYGTLQMLTTIIRAPKEVRVTDTTYPLCCSLTITPPWQGAAKTMHNRHTLLGELASSSTKNIDRMPTTFIRQDQEALDAISFTTPMANAPVSATVPASRASANPFRGQGRSKSQGRSTGPVIDSMSFVKTFTRYAGSAGSLSSRASSKSHRNAPQRTADKPMSNFCEIMIHGYGNGIYEPSPVSAQTLPSELSAEVLPEVVMSSQSSVHAPTESELPRFVRSRSSTGTAVTSQEPWSISRFASLKRSLSSHSIVESADCSLRRSNAVSERGSNTPDDLSLVSPSSSNLGPCTPTGTSFDLPGSNANSSWPILRHEAKNSMDLPMVVSIERSNLYQSSGRAPYGFLAEDKEVSY